MDKTARAVCDVKISVLSPTAWISAVLCPAADAAAACSPRIEEQVRWETAVVQPRVDSSAVCRIDEPSYRKLVSDWLTRRESGGPAIKSFFMGRSTYYPWLAEYIARFALQADDWDAHRGTARTRSENEFVALAIIQPAMRARLMAPFVRTAYRIKAVAVEKVLIGDVTSILSAAPARVQGVPSDAQVWLILEKVR